LNIVDNKKILIVKIMNYNKINDIIIKMEVYFGAANVVAPSDLDKWIEKVMDVMRFERNNYWVLVAPKETFTHSEVKRVVTRIIDDFKRASLRDADSISCGGFKASCNSMGEIIISYKEYRPYQTGIFR